MVYLAMVAKGDVVIHEAKLPGPSTTKNPPDNQLQFIVHQALDSLEQKMKSSSHMYLKEIDIFNNMPVSAFVTAGHIKFLLLYHAGTLEDSAIKQFFTELYKNYVKICMNPFYLKNTPITSGIFADKVYMLARNYFLR